MNFSSMKVGVRLGIGFASMVLLLLAVAMFSNIHMQTTGSIMDSLINENLKNERFVSEWQAIIAANLPRTQAIGKTSDPEVEKFFLSEIEKNSARVTELQQKVADGLTDPVAKSLYAVVVEERATYRKNRDIAFKAKAAGNTEAARRYFDVDLQRAATTYLSSIEKLQTQQKELINAMGRKIHEDIRQKRLLLATSALAAMSLAIALGYAIMHSLLRQLGGEPDYVTRIAGQIASGNLSVAVVTRENDQSSLLYAMKTMRDSLGAMIRQVHVGADTIDTAAHQIATGNLDLSSRTEQQAGALEKTATSMAELTLTVKQNTEHVRQANALVVSASEVAVKSGQAVSRVVETMGSINASSKKIVDIISVIDGIAFQTNILALNAAVEAARAGEQGRGFAVVATEVRNLAQRSAASAKEIKQLIDASVEQVEAGSRLVNQAGGTMDEVVSSVRHVTDIMGEIAAASREQEADIEQINQVITGMDNVTQQNTALVEAAATATLSMQEQADNLVQVVSVFKLDGAQRPSAPRATASVSAVSVNPALHPKQTWRPVGHIASAP